MTYKGESMMKKNVFFLGLLPFLMVLGNSMFFPILPDIQANLNLTPFETSMFLSIFSIPAAVLIPFIGVITDRIGRKIVVLASLVILVIGCIISAFANAFPTDVAYLFMMLGRLLQGIGAAGTAPIAMVIVGDIYEGIARSHILGMLEVFNGIGKVISPIIGAFAAILFWESTFYFYFIIACICFYGIYRFIPSNEKIENKQKLSVYFKKIKAVFLQQFRWIVPIFIAGGAGLFLLFGLLFFLSFELDVMYQMNGMTKGVLLALPLATLTIASYWTGKQIGNDINMMKRYLLQGLLLIFLAFSLLLFFRGLFTLLLLVSIVGIGIGMFLPAANTAATASVGPEERGLVVSLYSTIRFLGVAFGPISFSFWMRNIEDLFFYSLSIVGVVIVLLCVSWTCIPIFKHCSNTY